MCHAAEDKLEHTTLERSKVRQTERGFLTDYSPRPFVSVSQTFPFWLLGLEPSMVSTLHFSGIRKAFLDATTMYYHYLPITKGNTHQNHENNERSSDCACHQIRRLMLACSIPNGELELVMTCFTTS
jgi:hypothetical protein